MDAGRARTSATRNLTLGTLAAVTALASCSLIRWNAKPDVVQGGDWDSTQVRLSSAAARTGEPAPPPASVLPDDSVTHYADLGPDEIDVSGYPTQQKYAYGLFKQSCGRCHTLARAINSPAQGRAYWHFHLSRMNLHLRLSGNPPLDPVELKTLLDFLEYDARIRKIEHRRDFERLIDELKARYDRILEKRIHRLQTEPQPRLLVD